MNPFLPVVNQKALYSRLLLDQAAVYENQRHIQQALLQGAVFHLFYAFELYLKEIAASYQCRNASAVTDIGSLIQLLESAGKSPAEAAEILDLCQMRGSWPNRLESCFNALGAVIETVVKPADDALIPAFSTTEIDDWSLISSVDVESWLSSLNAMVERQREVMVEC